MNPSLLPLMRQHLPPQVQDYEKQINTTNPQNKTSSIVRPNTKQRFFDEIYALDKLQQTQEDDDQSNSSMTNKPRTQNKNCKKKSKPVLLKLNGNHQNHQNKFQNHHDKRKHYYFNLYEDELLHLSEKQNVRIVRNIMDYVRFYCPIHPKNKKFRLMDIEELIHFPLIIPKYLTNLLGSIAKQDQANYLPPGIKPRPELFSAMPMYSSSLAMSGDSKWKLPKRSAGSKIEDEMIQKLKKKSAVLSSIVLDHPPCTDRSYPTSVPNTAASPTSINLKNESFNAKLMFPLRVGDVGGINADQKTNAVNTLEAANTDKEQLTEEQKKVKFIIELMLRLQEYFQIAKMKPIQWFDILTDYKKDSKQSNNVFQQNLYYNEFYYGLMKFCKEMNLIPFKEYEIELLFQYFVRESLWVAFLEHVRMKEELDQLQPTPTPAISPTALFTDQFQPLNQQHLASSLSKPDTRSRSGSTDFGRTATRSNSSLFSVPTAITASTPTETQKTNENNFLPYIRRHDFKLGFKKLHISYRRILWLNHQADILDKCSQYFETLNISLYHYNMKIMMELSRKQSQQIAKDSPAAAGIGGQAFAGDLTNYLDDESISVISTSSLQNVQNFQLLENKLISLRDLESMLSKLLNDVMVFVNTKDVRKVLKDYQLSKNGATSAANEDDVSEDGSGISDISFESLLELNGKMKAGMRGKKKEGNQNMSPAKSPAKSLSLPKNQTLTVINPFSNSANSLLNEELSTSSLFDDVLSDSSSLKTASSKTPTHRARFSEPAVVVYPESTGINSGPSSRNRNRTTTLHEEDEETEEKSVESKLVAKRGLSIKFIAPLLSSKLLLSSNDSNSRPSSKAISRVASNDPAVNEVRKGSSAPLKPDAVNQSPIHQNSVPFFKQKSVRLSVPGDDVIYKQRKGAGGDEEELNLTYMSGEFRSSVHEYTFDLVSRPPSTGLPPAGADAQISGGRPIGILSRQNSRVNGLLRASRDKGDNLSINSQNSSSNNSYSRVSSKLKSLSNDRVDLNSLSQDSNQGSMNNNSITSMTGKLRKASISLNPNNTYSFDNYEAIKATHFILQKYSAEKISHPFQPTSETNKLNVDGGQGGQGNRQDPAVIQQTVGGGPGGVGITVKDPAIENPHRFYEEYKQFGKRMQEENQKHYNHYRSITQNFDRRISLAKVRLHQIKYGKGSEMENSSILKKK